MNKEQFAEVHTTVFLLKLRSCSHEKETVIGGIITFLFYISVQ